METTNNNIVINNRSEIEIKGIRDIISYDNEKVIFKLSDSSLALFGENFVVKKVDVENGWALVLGKLYSLSFSNSNYSPKSFLSSLFK